MKRTFLLALLLFVALGLTSVGLVNAGTFTFEDMIDTWGKDPLGNKIGVRPIFEGVPFTYQHDLNDNVNFAAGELVTEAWLELDFTNDLTDAVGSGFWGLIKWDYSESVTVFYTGTTWLEDLGEVDNGQYKLALIIDWLNDDGFLDVTIDVTNPLGTATAYLDHSRLYGTAATPAVPEPATVLLLGSGLIGLAAIRKKLKK